MIVAVAAQQHGGDTYYPPTGPVRRVWPFATAAMYIERSEQVAKILTVLSPAHQLH
jgi:hypothetical protein